MTNNKCYLRREWAMIQSKTDWSEEMAQRMGAFCEDGPERGNSTWKDKRTWCI